MSPQSGDRRTIVLTGGTSGIGLAAAPALAASGARLILVARNPRKVDVARAAIAAATGRTDIDIVSADLSRLDEVRNAAAEIAARTDRIDVLINNAGLYLGAPTPTPEGFDTVHVVNTLAPLLLTAGLWPKLRAATAARVVNVASIAHRWGRLDLDHLDHRARWAPMRAYAGAKLQTVMWTRELARRAAGQPVVPVSVHPGAIYSNFAQEDGGFLGPLMRVGKFVLSSTETGAAPIVALANQADLGPEAAGAYYERHAARRPSRTARRMDHAQVLWERLCERLGLPTDWPTAP